MSIMSLWLVWHPMYLFTHPSDNGGDQYYFNIFFFNRDMFIYCICMYVFLIIMFYCVYRQMSEIKNYYIIIIAFFLSFLIGHTGKYTNFSNSNLIISNLHVFSQLPIFFI